MTFTRNLQEHRERQEAAQRSRNEARKAVSFAGLLAKPAFRTSAVIGGALRGPVEKENVCKSAAYENAVRDLGYCVRCGRFCSPQFCHRDEGKGTGIKTDVRLGWAGCGECHYFVGTSGNLPKEQRRAEDLEMGKRTRVAVRAAGTWPKSVPQWDEERAKA